MTNVKLLKEKILASGVKFSFIAEKIGMTRQGLCKKFDDGTDFKAWQMIVISDILHLTDDQEREIFFADDVDKKST